MQPYAADVLKKAAQDHHSMDADDRQTLLSFLSSSSEYAPQSGQLTGILKTMQDREGKIRAKAKEFPKIILELGVCSDPALVKNTVQAHKEGS